MARFNEILVGRYNRFLQKLLSMKGGPVAAQLASELQPVFPFFNGVENRFLETWARYTAAAPVSAIALQNGAAQLRNPATSNVIAVVERLGFLEGLVDTSGVQINQDTGTAAFGAAVGQRCLDNRFVRGSTQTQGPSCQVSVGNNVPVTGGRLAIIPVEANEETSFILTQDQEITVLPGDSLIVFSGIVNVGMVVNFMWRERLLEESERF
jgi:hypothetical protein